MSKLVLLSDRDKPFELVLFVNCEGELVRLFRPARRLRWNK